MMKPVEGTMDDVKEMRERAVERILRDHAYPVTHNSRVMGAAIYDAGAADYEARLEAAEQRERALREALRKYGIHEVIDGVGCCAVYSGKPCTCGLEALLKTEIIAKHLPAHAEGTEIQVCTREAPHVCRVNGPCNGLPKDNETPEPFSPETTVDKLNKYRRTKFMRFMKICKDGGPESPVTGLFLIEIKSLFSVVLLRFGGTREAYHSHAFNALTLWLKGSVREWVRTDKYEAARTWDAGDLKFTPRNLMHKIEPFGKSAWALSFRGPWVNTWKEFFAKDNKTVTLTHGRKIVA